MFYSLYTAVVYKEYKDVGIITQNETFEKFEICVNHQNDKNLWRGFYIVNSP